METVILLIATSFCCALFYYMKFLRRPKNYPPGPNWYLPFIGNTSQVRKISKESGGQHLAFEKLSQEYKSPVIGLKLGNELVVVATTYPIVKDLSSREEFDGRPDTFFLRLRTMGTRLGVTCTDGPLWNEHRSFVVRHLRQVGYGRAKMEVQIKEELSEILGILDASNEKPTWPQDILPPSVINILWTFTTGSRIKRNDPRLIKFLGLMQKRSKVFDMSGGTLNQMPWLRFFAPEKTGYNLIRSLNKEFSQFFLEIINEHHEQYLDEKAGDDLIYAFIKEMKMQEGNQESTFTDIQLTMIILDIFIAGSQTTSITIDLALMMMLIRQDIQNRCHKEIESVLAGNEFTVNYSEKSKMPYIEAVLLEVQRFFHIVPISGPRRALKATTLGGFDIPRNTTILIGLRTVHMDKSFWKDPEVFRPERFLDENNNIVNTERLIPFGLGKRRCLGDQLAKACIFTFFVGILQRFNLKKSENDPPCLKLLPGITLSPQPYKIVFERR